MTVGETKRVEWPRAYKEATEKYSSQVKLSADGRSMENYVAGQPFAKLDPKDPQFVTKIMFNYDYGYVNGLDDTDLRNFDADTGSIADHGPMTIERHFLLDHFRRLFWTGRLYVDPKPEKPNPNGYRAQQGLYPVLEPFDLKGVGALGNRYISPDKQDDSWLYLPSLRRVRRLSTAQRSDALFGQYTDIYDRSGELWKIWINDVGFRKKAFDGAGVIEYEDELPFAPAIVMVDMQLEHATKASLPSPRFPGEQGWYYHQSDKAGVTDDWFTVAALVNAGH